MYFFERDPDIKVFSDLLSYVSDKVFGYNSNYDDHYDQIYQVYKLCNSDLQKSFEILKKILDYLDSDSYKNILISDIMCDSFLDLVRDEINGTSIIDDEILRKKGTKSHPNAPKVDYRSNHPSCKIVPSSAFNKSFLYCRNHDVEIEDDINVKS